MNKYTIQETVRQLENGNTITELEILEDLGRAGQFVLLRSVGDATEEIRATIERMVALLNADVRREPGGKLK